jgi:hypothetical protein
VAEAGAEAKGAAARQPVFRPFFPQKILKTRLKKPIFQLFSRKITKNSRKICSVQKKSLPLHRV